MRTQAEERTADVIPRRIRQLREARGWSQEMLCERARISSDSITRIERGVRKPSVATLERIAEALGVDLAALVTTGQPAKATYGAVVERVAAILDAQPAHVQRGAETIIKAFVRVTADLSDSRGRRRKSI